MFKSNSLQFSVVREDPQIEFFLFGKYKIKNAALIGSAGCTALALCAKFPNTQLTAIDPNRFQLDLMQKKADLLYKNKSNGTRLRKLFGVGPMSSTQKSFIEKGNFETLFRGLRNFIYDFVIDQKSLTHLLKTGTKQQLYSLFKHPYWPVGFDLYFSDSILKTMFGPAAIQHAPKNSYPGYFRKAIEKGLLREDRNHNYFLSHILLGYYPTQKTGWPYYLTHSTSKKIKISKFLGTAQDYTDYSPFDFVGLSNIFDWSSSSEIRKLTSKLKKEMKPGSVLLYRQLNNQKNFEPLFGSEFNWDKKTAHHYLKADRSLFYSSIHIARKIK